MAKLNLDFEKLILFNAGEKGVLVNTTLRLSDKEISFPSKIDTGSSFYIFERRFGKELGLEIEKGLFQNVGTATREFSKFSVSDLL